MRVKDLRYPYDARGEGAQCALCPLSTRKPVPPKKAEGRLKLVIVAESPGPNENAVGVPLIGATGEVIDRILVENGIQREETHITNAILCAPYKRTTGAQLSAAQRCCAPRLEKELAELEPSGVLAVGGLALKALVGKSKILAWEGAPLESKYGPVMPMQHPAALMRSERGFAKIPVLSEFVRRLILCQEGLYYEEAWPRLYVKEDEIEEGLRLVAADAAAGGAIGVDVETNSTDPEESRLKCIGLASSRTAVSVPFPFASDRISALLRRTLTSSCTKVVQNGQFDRRVFECQGIEIKGPYWDTLGGDAILNPLLQHNLGFMGVREFQLPRWKSEFHESETEENKGGKFWDAVDQIILRSYNAKDAWVQLRLYEAQRPRIYSSKKLTRFFGEQGALEDIALQMRRDGILLDEGARQRHKVKLTELRGKAEEGLQRITRAMGFVPSKGLFNPRSPTQVNNFFLKCAGVAPIKLSEKTGKPSFDEEVLERLRAGPDEDISLIADGMLEYRKYDKLLGTYVDGLPISPDGRVRAWWKPTGVVTLRWGSSPNLQTIPKPKKERKPDGSVVMKPGLRDMFVAPLGRHIVEADWNALELRVIAAIAGMSKLLEWFGTPGVDVHTKNAVEVFGFDMSGDLKKENRQLAKTNAYLLNYKGSPKKLHRVMRSDFPDLKLEQVEKFAQQWITYHHELDAYHQAMLKQGETLGYVETPISGWRRQVDPNRVKLQEVANFPIQSFAAWLMNQSLLHYYARKPAGDIVLAQVHDALVVECDEPEVTGRLLKQCMQQTFQFAGGEMEFKVEIQVGDSWGRLTELHT